MKVPIQYSEKSHQGNDFILLEKQPISPGEGRISQAAKGHFGHQGRKHFFLSCLMTTRWPWCKILKCTLWYSRIHWKKNLDEFATFEPLAAWLNLSASLIAIKMHIFMSSQQKTLVYALWHLSLVYAFWTCKPVNWHSPYCK